MAQRRVHVLISGRVQGVFFRACTEEEAQRLGLGGWVRNCPDGSVEAVFEGESDLVARMLEWCWMGSPASQVKRVNVEDETPHGEDSGFQVRYY